MAATSTDVARHAGVSRSTVSYILNGHADRFSPETRELVERAVAELNYQPQAAGRTLARGHSDIVLMVTPLAANADYSAMVDVLTERFYEKGLSLLMRSASAAIDSFTSVINAVQPRAVISGAALSRDEENVLRAAGVRVVDFAKMTSRPGGMNWQIGARQVDHLHQRGYSEIQFVRLEVHGENPFQDSRERGVRERCEQLSLPFLDPITIDERADLDPSTLHSIATGTGLACYNDDVAAGVLAAAREIGRPVPNEIGIIGADNSTAAAHATPHITTIGFDYEIFFAFVVNAVTAKTKPRTSTFAPDLFVVQGGTT